jgi:RHS repeat-associated protein
VTSETNAAIDHLFTFTGRALDESTGLQNNLNRWYDAETGRWLSQDPIAFEGGDSNLYRYVANSPILSADPSGLEGVVIVWYPTPVPNEFKPKKVQARMREALKKAGVKARLYLRATDTPPNKLDLGYNFDMEYYWSHTEWHSWVNPLWYIAATAHDGYTWFATEVLSYEMYVHWNPAKPRIGLAYTNAPHVYVYYKKMPAAIANAPSGPGDEVISYANILLHEVFWQGVLDRSDVGHLGRPGNRNSLSDPNPLAGVLITILRDDAIEIDDNMTDGY